jgi:heterodisulfide reductase subunit B
LRKEGGDVEELDIQLNEIPDWNCCAASIGYAGGGELPRLTLSARNIALSEQHNPGQEIVATCAACWLSTREAQERLHEDKSLFAECNAALAEAGLKFKGEVPIKHMAEVLIEDIGYEAIAAKVKKPLSGIKIAGYVGCQTNRSFGIAGESYENPKYLDKLVESLGGDSIPHDEKKVQCCGGALACDDEIVPLQARIETVTDDSDLEKVYNSERHLLYVACTRARDHLLVSRVEPASAFPDDLRAQCHP